jgi:hypothetical protein
METRGVSTVSCQKTRVQNDIRFLTDQQTKAELFHRPLDTERLPSLCD